MDKAKGLEILTGIIEKDLRHQDYVRVTELAQKYYAMDTGDKLTDMLRRIVTRETEEEFNQRKEISKPVIPSTLNSTKLPFKKVCRKKPLIRELIYKSGDAKKTELEEFISKYWGEKSLEEYLEFADVHYNYVDPNAFLITEFGAFDPNREKASPYPFVASSEEAIMFEYKNEILQYLVVMLPVKFKDGDFERDGFKYTMYLGKDTIQLTRVADNWSLGSFVDIETKNGKQRYQVEYFLPKADKVPAVRFGYERDAETKSRTFVSVFHPVLLLLEKMMKTDSELDLSTAMTAFPQRFAYVDACTEPDCLHGKKLDGTKCETCKGTGQSQLHGGVKDVVTLTLPRSKDEMVELENLLVYKAPPTEILDFNKEFVNDLRILVHMMMFNNEISTKSETAQNVTATEKNYSYENMNDTLYGFARNYSSLWEFVVRDIATFTDNSEGLTVHHKFPGDFKFKGLVELMIELKTAKDAGASTSTISAIEDDINEILYSDRPSEKKKIEIKSLMNPFRGYTESTARLIISQNQTTKFNAVLYSNLESIFNEIELDTPDIYDMNIVKIREIVTKKTNEYMVTIESEKPEVVETPFTGR